MAGKALKGCFIFSLKSFPSEVIRAIYNKNYPELTLRIMIYISIFGPAWSEVLHFRQAH